MFSLSYIETKSCREVLCRARTNDKKLARILTKSNLPSEGLFYKLGSYHQLPGSILPNPSSAEVYYPTLVLANGHHPSPVLSILPSAHVPQNWQKPFGFEILHCSSLWRLSQCHIYVQLICYLIKDDSAGAFWWTLSFIRFVILHTHFLCVFCICKRIIA